jgi:hypothetical protein
MKRVLFAVAIGVPAIVLSLNACKKEETASTAGSGSVSAAAASASGATSLTALTSASPTDTGAPTADPDKLPAPTAQATAPAVQAISTANYKTELDAVEKELNGIK